jgi:hypothetical protein
MGHLNPEKCCTYRTLKWKWFGTQLFINKWLWSFSHTHIQTHTNAPLRNLTPTQFLSFYNPDVTFKNNTKIKISFSLSVFPRIPPSLSPFPVSYSQVVSYCAASPCCSSLHLTPFPKSVSLSPCNGLAGCVTLKHWNPNQQRRLVPWEVKVPKARALENGISAQREEA